MPFSLFNRRAAVAVLMLAAGMSLSAPPASAAGGDVFAQGTSWCASTYPGHGTLSGFGPALDMGSASDFRWPIYAPGDGSVEIYSEGWGSGWGNSIIWTRDDGDEKIHMAHLDDFGETGKVDAGDLIGYVGETGEATGPHLHASAQVNGKPAPLFLMGREIVAGECYTSTGPIPPLCQGEQATIIGGRGDDELIGTSGRDVILGKGGDDSIDGRGGSDVMCGGRGEDELVGKVGNDRSLGGPDADVLRGGGGGDRLEGAKASDRLVGGLGGDKLIGGPGGDRLVGGKKADRLVPGAGSDLLRGGSGRDSAIFVDALGGVRVDLAEGTAGGEGRDTLATIERIRGSSFDDEIAGDAEANTLFGGKGDDDLDGAGGHDTIDGGAGVDDCSGEVLTACEP